MENKLLMCLLFLVVLTLDGVILQQVDETEGERVKNRQKRLALPVVYYGAVISYELFLSLAAVYTAAVVSRAIARKVSDDNHSCANNRGWCRSSCLSHEYIDWYNSAVCGDYHCCR